jgi:hypothetical protein
VSRKRRRSLPRVLKEYGKCSIGFSSFTGLTRWSITGMLINIPVIHRKVTMEKKRISDMRRKIRRLHQKLSTLGPLMRGTVVLLGSTCGNPRCKCARGEKHPQYYFSVNIDRKTKTMYLRKEMRSEAEEYVTNYKLLWDIVEEMTLLNFELLKSKKP